VNPVGYEWDQHWPGVSPPSTQIVMTSPVDNYLGELRYHHSTYYEHPDSSSGPPISRIFAAGTIQWSWGIEGPGADTRLQAITRRVIACLRSPQRLPVDRETIFKVDLSHLDWGPEDPVWLFGRSPPLEVAGSGRRLWDDGNWPDEFPADGVFSAAVTFPAGSWSIVEYWYETVGPCTPSFYSAWIDDPETMVGERAILAVDRPNWCPRSVAIGGDPNPSSNGDLRLTVQSHTPATIALVVSVPDRLVGKPFRASIYDAAGRLRIVIADIPSASSREVLLWQGLDWRGREVARGLYFVRVRVGAVECKGNIPWLE
jgi:hypothetical protein